MTYRQILCSLVLGLLVVGLTVPVATANNNNSGDESEYGPYRIIMRTYGEADWIAVRYRVDTGETWRAARGSWTKVEEEGSDPGEGTFHIVISIAQDGSNWWPLRYNTDTGKTWKMTGGNWKNMNVVVEE